MSWPAIMLWVAICGSALSSGPALFYLTIVSGVFGSLQMLPGDVVGGVNLLPQSVCACALVIKVATQKKNIYLLMSAAINPRKLGLLFLFLFYAVSTAFILPRVFADGTQVIALSTPFNGLTNLVPSSSNLNQAAYMSISVGVLSSIAILGSDRTFKDHYLQALLFLGISLVTTGVLDFFLSSVGQSSLLEPFRTASYNLLVDDEVLGAKRVVGLMPEASSYGGACVVVLANLCLLRPCFGRRARRGLVPLTILALLAMVFISTSSGSYVGLAALVMVFGLNWAIRQFAPNALSRECLTEELIALLGFLLVALAVVIADSNIISNIYDAFDTIVFKKPLSSSYYERNLWTQTAWSALFDTLGLGVGLGGARTSNWFVAVLSNTGFAGGALLFSFIAWNAVPRFVHCAPPDREMRRALQLGLVPTLLLLWVGGTTPDIGVSLATTIGMLVALNEHVVDGVDSDQPFVVFR